MNEDTSERPLWHLASEWSPPAEDDFLDESKLPPEYALQFAVPGVDWWYYATALTTIVQISNYKIEPTANGGIMHTYRAVIKFIVEGDKTTIIVRTGPNFLSGWDEHFYKLGRFAVDARKIRRAAIGHKLVEVLDDYYATIERGGRVKLKSMAEAAGVNYGSLRQAKFRYDEERRKNAKGD